MAELQLCRTMIRRFSMDHELRYCVTGVDGNGDRHTFETDDGARAGTMLALWRIDFRDVASSLTDRQSPPPSPAG